MSQKDKDCAYWIAVLLAGVTLGSVLGIVVISLFYPVFQSNKWAAWVQAIGSIGAIGATVFVMRAQAKEIEKRDQERRRRLLGQKNEDLMMFIEQLLETTSSLITHAKVFEVHILDKGADDRTDYAILFQVLAGSIGMVNLSDFSAVRLSGLILSIRQHAEALVSLVRKIEVDSMNVEEAKQNIKLTLMFLESHKKTLINERDYLIVKIDTLS